MDRDDSQISTISAAEEYVGRGWAPVPVPYQGKAPVLDGWGELRLGKDDLPSYFTDDRPNIGILLGEPSGGLIDVDLDAPEALELADIFLPETDSVFGRAGKQRSHRLYVATQPGRSSQFADLDGAMLVECRATGVQTIFPPSVHQSGEPIRWVQFGSPARVDGQALRDDVSKLAAATLMARNWPKEGSRQNAALALAGGLLRAGWAEKSVELFIYAIAMAAGDEELKKRATAAEYTEQKLESDRAATGWPTLAGLVGDKVVEKACAWLGIKNSITGQKGEGVAGMKKSQASRLVELAQDITLWHSPEIEGFATVLVGTHRENWLLNSKGFKRWLSRRFYGETGTTPNSQAVQDALGVLGGMATFDGDEHRVVTRIGGQNGNIYLDLANPNWEAVEITPSGWNIMSDPPVKFRRSRGLYPLPHPATGGDINDLRPFVNVATDSDFMLLVACLVAAFRPSGPYPVLALHGEQGTAKSTLCRVLRQLVDPNKADLRSAPKEPRDLMIAATNGWFIALDNISYLPGWLSDALCRLSTGGGFGTRSLYQNEEETLFDSQRPVILTGIGELATSGDLVERTVLLYLEKISKDKRRSETDFWAEFDAARPEILGAVLDGVSMALRNVNEVSLKEVPRMADFAIWSVAAAPAFGWNEKQFTNAYSGNQESANELTLEASPVVPPLQELLGKEDWEGTASELLEVLTSKVTETVGRSKPWPKTARTLGIILRRLSPNLRAEGMEVEFKQTSGKNSKRLIIITQERNSSDANDANDAQAENNQKTASDAAW